MKNKALSYYTSPVGFRKDLAHLLQKCEVAKNDYPLVLFASDVSNTKLADNGTEHIFFLVFWSYTHAIVHQICECSLQNSNNIDIAYAFCKMTGYPMFSLGLGGVMDVKQTLMEFRALERLTHQQKDVFNKVAAEVQDYIKSELKVFLNGQQVELFARPDYQRLVKTMSPYADDIIKGVDREIVEIIQYNFVTVDKQSDCVEFAIGKAHLKMVKVLKDDSENPIYIATTTVTEKLWETIINGEYCSGNSNLPKTNVNLDEVTGFIDKLSDVTGITFRLPTFKEWQLAAHGGVKSLSCLFAGSNHLNDVAWCRYNSDRVVHEVALKQPNELGLYDMSGNVWEMTSDTKMVQYMLIEGEYKVGIDCGGCFYDKENNCKIDNTNTFPLNKGSEILGFRLVCVL